MKNISLRLLFIVGVLSASVALALLVMPAGPELNQNEAVRICLTEDTLLPDTEVELNSISAEVKHFPIRVNCYWEETAAPNKVITTTKFFVPVPALWIAVQVLLWVPLAGAISVAVYRGIQWRRQKTALPAADGDSAAEHDSVGSTTE
ncbi:MAG: hypothetical protein Q4E03_00240 [Trueperella sp.]|nr:hypothetical protein [Trueperella sp.]